MYPKKTCRPRSSKISCELLRKQSATPFAMPSPRSSTLIFAGIHLTSFLRSSTTDPASLIRRRRAEKDSDFPTCGPGPKISEHNLKFELRPVAALLLQFTYRSISKVYGAIFGSSSIEAIRTALANHSTSPSSVLTFDNLNINTETNMSIVGLNEVIDVTAELREVEVREVPFGTFAGTLNRLVVLQNGNYPALDTGDQGGGQN